MESSETAKREKLEDLFPDKQELEAAQIILGAVPKKMVMLKNKTAPFNYRISKISKIF